MQLLFADESRICRIFVISHLITYTQNLTEKIEAKIEAEIWFNHRLVANGRFKYKEKDDVTEYKIIAMHKKK